MDIIKKKEMNFEYLRIFSMVLIILSHYAGHGGVAEINLNNINKFIGSFLEIGGKLGVNLFVMISGYFLVNSKFKIEKVFKLIFQVTFYSIILGAIGFLVSNENCTVKNIIKCMFPIVYSLYWFPTAYIGMYLLSPFFNKLIYSLNRENYKMLLVILFIILSLIPTIFPGANMYNASICWLIFIYFIAAYIRRYDLNIKIKNSFNIYISMAIWIIIFIFQCFCILAGEKIEFLKNATPFLRGQSSVPILVMSIYLFIFFKNIKAKEYKLPITLAKTSFGVYLFHDNPFFKDILWNKILKVQDVYYENLIVFIAHIILSVIIIYSVGSIIEETRQKVFEKRIFKIKSLNNLCYKINNLINIQDMEVKNEKV